MSRGPMDPGGSIEDRISASLHRHAGDAAGSASSPKPVGDVLRRSRRMRARQRATGAAGTLVVLALVTAVVATSLSSSDTGGGGDGGGRGDLAGPSTPAEPNLQLASALQPFDSCEAFLGWVKAAAKERVGPYGFGSRYQVRDYDAFGEGFDGAGGPRFADGPESQPQASLSPGTASGRAGAGDESARADSSNQYATKAVGQDQVSGTNTVEKGVDEPDVVKADPTRIVTLLEGKIATFAVNDGAPRYAGSVTLPSPAGTQAEHYYAAGNGRSSPQLLMAGDRLLVVDQAYLYSSGGYGSEDAQVYDRSIPGASLPTTVLTQVDISDLAQPKLLDTIRIEGAYVSTRMVGTTARVVVSSITPKRLGFVYPSMPGDTVSEDAAAAANQKVIDGSTIDNWVPGYRKGNAYTTESSQGKATPLLDCTRMQHPKEFAGFGTVSVVTLDVAGAFEPADAVGVVATADRVYASPNRLYVSTVREPYRILSEAPRTMGTSATAPPATTPPRIDTHTAIHAFDISGSGPAVYRASGVVTGRITNDFAMSDLEGTLRVASQAPPENGRPFDETLVTVLQERDGALAKAGEVGGLGRGEQIKAVRFIGKVGYVVTFRQTDPLYTIDLNDPTNPRVAGELKMLGYSAYLHPVGDGRLLGVGQDATEGGRATGTQVVLYDVTNPATPTVLSKATLPISGSLVESDYHAFLWWAGASLAVIPVNGYDGGTQFTGAIGFTVLPDKAVELARVVNPITGLWCPPGVGCVVPGGITCDAAGMCPPPPVPIGDPILRSVVMGDNLLTLSRGGIQLSSLTDLRPRTWVPYPFPTAAGR